MHIIDRVLTALRLITEVEERGDGPATLRELILTRLIKDAEQSTRHDHCVICEVAGEHKRVSDLQQHHIAGKFNGRPNFEDIITVCSRCHDYLSDHQKSWLNSQRDPASKLVSYLCGWSDVFELLFSKTGLFYFRDLASKFRSQAWHLRNASRKKRAAT